MLQDQIKRAAGLAAAIARNVRADQFGGPTPCSEYDVRALARHVSYWSPMLEAAGNRKPYEVPATGEQEHDVDPATWGTVYSGQLRDLAAAWADPASTEGMASMGSAEMSASLIGEMVLGEILVHGWDLAGATGQELEMDDDLAQAVLVALEGSAELGREMGIYGPAVAVPDTAPAFDRALGLTGRDPKWTAG